MSKREREQTTQEDTNNSGTSSSSLAVYSSNAPSAHAVGIASVALNAKEDRLIVAREDGSIALCKVIPVPVRHTAAVVPLVRTGSNEGRTVTRILFALSGSVIVAAYLSGQIAIYDAATLAPLHVAERVGGAIWDMVSIRTSDDNTGEELVCACADGSWYHFALARKQSSFQLNLIQVFPKIVGAHRALSVALCGSMLVGSDDCGNVVAWAVPEKGTRKYEQLWLTRLPKGAYAKSIAFDAATNFVVVGTSLGDVGFIRGDKGDIVSVFTNHQGPITSVISAGQRTVLATGWHESLRAYRFVEGKWIPSEVRRRTHYHEATQLLHLAKADAVLGASRDGTLLIASLADNLSSPPKYTQPAPQQYAYAANVNVVLTVAGSRVEMYQSNEAMTHWAPLALYTAHGGQGVRGVWCDSDLTRVVVATTTRVVVLSCVRKSTNAITLTKVVDYKYANTHACVIVGNSDVYIVHDGDKLSHVSINISATSCIESHMTLPIKGTALGLIGDEKALLVASSVDGSAAARVKLNEDGSFASNAAESIESFRADTINNVVSVAQFQSRFFDISTSQFSPLPPTLPADTVFFAKFENPAALRNKTMWMGYCPRGLLISTPKSWWLADEEHRTANKKAVDAEALDRSTTVALSSGPRTTFVAAFAGSGGDKVLVLRRDIESEVEALPLMWKVRRFGN